MFLFSALFVAVTLQKDRTQTLGYSYAQILAMGTKKWGDLVLDKQGSSTYAMANGFSVYGDALAWRNDRLLKGRPFPLRQHFNAFSSHAQEVGYALSGGGTMWTVYTGQSHLDTEAAIYTILSHTYRGPHRVVSDVTKAIDRLGSETQKIQGKDRQNAQKAVVALRGDLKSIAADARRFSRKDSDATLDFCRTTTLAIIDQVTPK